MNLKQIQKDIVYLKTSSFGMIKEDELITGLSKMHVTGSYTEVTGNILDYHAPYYIAHQCNTQSKRPAGLSTLIFKKYPEANDYKRNTHGTVGTIHVIDHVINVFAQIKPGKPAGALDNSTKRAEYFESCLKAIADQLPKDATVVMVLAVVWLVDTGLHTRLY